MREPHRAQQEWQSDDKIGRVCSNEPQTQLVRIDVGREETDEGGDGYDDS